MLTVELLRKMPFASIDLHFAAYIQEQSKKDDPLVFAAAAIASAAVRLGHTCCNLNEFSGKNFSEYKNTYYQKNRIHHKVKGTCRYVKSSAQNNGKTGYTAKSKVIRIFKKPGAHYDKQRRNSKQNKIRNLFYNRFCRIHNYLLNGQTTWKI